MVKKQASLGQWVTVKKEKDEYTRVKEGKTEVVKAHEQGYQTRPQLSKQETNRVKKQGSKKLIGSSKEKNSNIKFLNTNYTKNQIFDEFGDKFEIKKSWNKTKVINALIENGWDQAQGKKKSVGLLKRMMIPPNKQDPDLMLAYINKHYTKEMLMQFKNFYGFTTGAKKEDIVKLIITQELKKFNKQKEAQKVKEIEQLAKDKEKNINEIRAEFKEYPENKAWRKWKKTEELMDSLMKDLAIETDIDKKNKINDQLKRLMEKSHIQYGAFREIVKEDVVKEEKEWNKTFLKGFKESHRFGYRTIEDLKEKKNKIKTIPNPFLDILFKNKTKKSSNYKKYVTVRLSPDGNSAYLKFDPGFYDSFAYHDYTSVVLEKYQGHWNKDAGGNVVPVQVLNNLLSDLKGCNPKLRYEVQGGSLADWKENTNVPKTIIGKSEFLLLESDGLNVYIKGEESVVNKAKNEIDKEFSRFIKRRKKKFVAPIDYDDDHNPQFNIGLLDDAYWLLEHLAFKPVVVDDRARRPVSSPELIFEDGKSLYPFLKGAMAEALIEGDGLMVSPTGSGKTELAIGIVDGFIRGAKRQEKETGVKTETDTLFLVHKNTLADQAEERFEKRLDIDVGRVTSNKKYFDPKDTPESDINVGSLQTLYKAIRKLERQKTLPVEIEKQEGILEALNGSEGITRKDLKKQRKKIEDLRIALVKSDLSERQQVSLNILDNAEVIIQDEAHHLKKDNSYDKVFTRNKTRHKYGLTATPNRYDTSAIMQVMRIGSRRVVATLKELQEKKILMKPKVIEYTISEHPSVKPQKELSKSKFHAEREAQIVNNIERNRIVSKLAKELREKDKQTIIFTFKRDHAEDLAGYLENELNLEVDVLHGKSGKKHQDRVKKNLASGKAQLVCATQSYIGEGYDLPSLDAIIIADGNGSSRIDVLQRAGRVMRSNPNKKQPIIIEFNDESSILTRHMGERREHYDETGAFDYYEAGHPSLKKNNLDAIIK